MEILNLLSEKDPILRRPIAAYPLSDDAELLEAQKVHVSQVAGCLEATRKAHKAIGLAANQVGLDIRMFVMGSEFAQFVCINPEIITHDNVTVIDTEGCLSFPKLYIKVPRSQEIQVKYLDVDLKEVTSTFKGTFARCFQHELDHLNGITFTSKVSRMVLAMAMKKRQVKQRHR